MPVIIGYKENPIVITKNRGTIERLTEYYHFKLFAQRIKELPNFKYVYPHMAYFGSGILENTIVYDIDFNNYFVTILQRMLEYPLVIVDGYPFLSILTSYSSNLFSFYFEDKNLLDVANAFIEYLQRKRDIMLKERHKLKKQYVLVILNNTENYSYIYDPVAEFLSGLYELKLDIGKPAKVNYKGKKIRSKDIISIYEEYGKPFPLDYDIAIDLAKVYQTLGYNVLVFDRYHFMKYALLSAIGYIKRVNARFWKLIMSVASTTLAILYNNLLYDGVEVYNIYVDSIQTNTNFLDMYKDFFELFPAKVDKKGDLYALVLPPIYFLEKGTEYYIKQSGIDYNLFWNAIINGNIFLEGNNAIAFIGLKRLCGLFNSIFYNAIEVINYGENPKVYIKKIRKFKKYDRFILWKEPSIPSEVNIEYYYELDDLIRKNIKMFRLV